VIRKKPEDRMAVNTGDTNQEMTTGVNPLRKGNCKEDGEGKQMSKVN